MPRGAKFAHGAASANRMHRLSATMGISCSANEKSCWSANGFENVKIPHGGGPPSLKLRRDIHLRRSPTKLGIHSAEAGAKRTAPRKYGANGGGNGPRSEPSLIPIIEAEKVCLLLCYPCRLPQRTPRELNLEYRTPTDTPEIVRSNLHHWTLLDQTCSRSHKICHLSSTKTSFQSAVVSPFCRFSMGDLISNGCNVSQHFQFVKVYLILE
jgi:hypothetical protein